MPEPKFRRESRGGGAVHSAGQVARSVGHAGIVKILSNTRFRLDDRVRTPEGWMAYWDVRRPSRRIVPLVCNVCAGVPDKITLSNLVSQTKSSARCACVATQARHVGGPGACGGGRARAGLQAGLSASEWVGALAAAGVEVYRAALRGVPDAAARGRLARAVVLRQRAPVRVHARDCGRRSKAAGEAAEARGEAAEGEAAEECAQ